MRTASAELVRRRVDTVRRLNTPALDFRLRAFDNSDPEIGIMTGIASTGSVDRMGDIVEPLGAVFKLPLPLLWQHDSRAPIGQVVAAKVTADGIEVRAEIHKTLAQSIGTQWELIKNGLVPALSIGFRPLQSEPLDPKKPFGGQRFTEWEWLELSSVTIPANPDALVTTAKHFCTDPDDPNDDGTSRAIASASAAPAPSKSPRQPARTPTPIKGYVPMKTQARIEELQREICVHSDTITETMTICETESRHPTEAEALAMKVAGEEIEKKSATLEAYAAAQQVEARKADGGRGGPAIIGAQSKSRDPGDFMFKTALVKLHSHVRQRDPDLIAEELYQHDAEAVQVIKTAVLPASTSVVGWAQELVRQDVQGFMDLLQPISLWRQLAAQGQQLRFNGANSIKVPGRAATPKVAGSFVGETAMIPVKKIGFTSVTISPYKMAVISSFSREIIEQSTPSVEVIVRQAMLDDTSLAIDTALLSSVAATVGIRPAGIQVGMTTSASAGNTLANIITDVRLMTSTVLNSGARKPVWIMDPQRVQGLGFITNATGQFMFKDEVAAGSFQGFPLLVSRNVPDTVVYLVDAADFISAFDAPMFEVSNQATLVEADDDGTPPYVGPGAGIGDITEAVTGTPPATVRSLFQTDTLALRMIMPLSWQQFRPANSYALTACSW